MTIDPVAEEHEVESTDESTIEKGWIADRNTSESRFSDYGDEAELNDPLKHELSPVWTD